VFSNGFARNCSVPKNNWERVKFGEVVHRVKDSDVPTAAESRAYIGLEHLESGSMTVSRWGSDVDLLETKTRVMQGDVLFARRNTHLRRVAVAPFDAFFSPDGYALRSADPRLAHEFLPWIVVSDSFMAYAISRSAGTHSKRVKWTDLVNYEFDLPPLAEQRAIADVLWASERVADGYTRCVRAHDVLSPVAMEAAIDRAEAASFAVRDLLDPERPLCYGVVQPGSNDELGVPLIRVCDLEGGEVRLAELRRISAQVHRDYRRSVIAAGDVLVSVVGTIGRCAVVPPEASGFNIARAIARLAPDRRKVVPEYLANVLETPRLQRALFGAGFESARRTLNLNSLAGLEIPVPPIEAQRAILRLGTELDSTKEAVVHRQQQLKILRQALLRDSL
jgi:type I restriction enzyme S subunit